MDTQNISRRVVKRRRANSSSNQKHRLVRLKVNIPDDTWLQVLKFITCPEWSQNRFVSRQMNRVAERNIFRLPKMVIDRAVMYYINNESEPPVDKLDKYAIVTFDGVLQKHKSTQWFKSRGYALNAPADIQAKNALIGARDKWTRRYDSNVHIGIHGYAREKISLSFEEERFPWFQELPDEGPYCDAMEFRKPVLYYAQFNPALNQYSWDHLAQFLSFIFHPTSYIEEVKMFAVNQNLIDSLNCNVDSVGNGPRYIRCVSFSLLTYCITDQSTDVISNSLKWLQRNVRAEIIKLPWMLQTSENLVLIANFLLDPAGAKQCASEKMTIHVLHETAFLNILIKKFHSIPLVEDGIPTTEFIFFRRGRLPAHLGPNLIAQEVDSEGAEDLYVISNRQNRMRISFRWAYQYDGKCSVRIYPI